MSPVANGCGENSDIGSRMFGTLIDADTKPVLLIV